MRTVFQSLAEAGAAAAREGGEAECEADGGAHGKPRLSCFDCLAPRWREDHDLITFACAPQTEKHAAARVRVDVGVAAVTGYRGARQMQRNVLRSFLSHRVPLEIALHDGEVDPEARDLDPISVGDRRRWSGDRNARDGTAGLDRRRRCRGRGHRCRQHGRGRDRSQSNEEDQAHAESEDAQRWRPAVHGHTPSTLDARRPPDVPVTP